MKNQSRSLHNSISLDRIPPLQNILDAATECIDSTFDYYDVWVQIREGTRWLVRPTVNDSMAENILEYAWKGVDNLCT